VLCSAMLEISILHVTSKILQLFLANIYVTHGTLFCVKFFFLSFTRYFLIIFQIIFNLPLLNTFIPRMIFLLFIFDIKTEVSL